MLDILIRFSAYRIGNIVNVETLFVKFHSSLVSHSNSTVIFLRRRDLDDIIGRLR